MPMFTVRVVLHSIQNKDHATYTKLHDEMEKDGFSREITGSKTYRMPPAEYSFEGTLTVVEVRDKARAVANRVHADNGVLVTQSAPDGRAWVGLKPA
ncbi:hypothetical protein [Burkholderia glumae]